MNKKIKTTGIGVSVCIAAALTIGGIGCLLWIKRKNAEKLDNIMGMSYNTR